MMWTGGGSSPSRSRGICLAARRPLADDEPQRVSRLYSVARVLFRRDGRATALVVTEHALARLGEWLRC